MIYLDAPPRLFGALTVIASAAKQSIAAKNDTGLLRRRAPRNDEK
jgi:hypothetical protein